jgi:hypothetical protein
MSAHTLASSPVVESLVGLKKAVVTVTGCTSYETGGSALDLSSIFKSKVYGISRIGTDPHGSDKYALTYVPAASNAPATGKIKIRDLTAASDAEVTSTTDLSATTWTLEVTGV